MSEEFSISNWRARHLFKENQDPQNVKPIEEVLKNENLVDEIGTFWVVKKPNSKSTKENILEEYDVFSFGEDYFGIEAQSPGDVLGIYLKRSDANRRATEAIKQRDTDLKEIEGAMNDYRDTKKSVEDKRTKAAEIIKRLK